MLRAYLFEATVLAAFTLFVACVVAWGAAVAHCVLS
jgi:hypothetical protein